MLQETLQHTNQKFKLNGERLKRHFSAEVCQTITQGKKKSYSATAMTFTLTYLGVQKEGFLNYKLDVTNRFLLNEKFSAIKKLNKAQKIALTAASINDSLNIQVHKTFKLNRIANTNEIRDKWNIISINLLKDYPDLKTMVSNFDWQLQEDNIQNAFLEDNFYSFFFSNIFYRDFNEKESLVDNKIIANALGSINIPIKEKKQIAKQDRAFEYSTIALTAEMDSKDQKFPLDKLNSFLGELPTNQGDEHDLNLQYNGTYKVKPQLGLVTKGSLNCIFEVKDLYKKTNKITFNLEQDE